MDNMFAGLEELGLGKTGNINIFEEQGKDEKQNDSQEKKEPVYNEIDFLFDKTMTCPVCEKTFKTKQVRTGKPKFLGTDSDLRPLYAGIDTVKYDAIVCPYCGYASLMRNFEGLTPRQIKEIKENISKDFQGIPNEQGAYSYPAAIQRYKLALYNEVVRHSRLSERAYLCLKIAWLYRGLFEEAQAAAETFEKCKEYAKNELTFTKNAYDGFLKALAKELPPICNMDEKTINYLMTELARRCQDYENAEKFAFSVISSKSANAKIKDKTREVLARIRQEKAQLSKENNNGK